MRVSEIMSRNPVTVSVDDPVAIAVETMEAYSIRHLPVMRGDELAGIVTDRDLRSYRPPSAVASANLADALDLMERTMKRVMLESPETVSANASALDALDRMLELRIGSLCVVHEERLVGIVTSVDLLRAARAFVADTWSR